MRSLLVVLTSGSSIKEVVRTIGEGLITRLVDSVVPGLGTAARVLMAFAWSLRERSEVRRFIKFMIKWRELSGGLAVSRLRLRSPVRLPRT
ncbi:hypothetical protein [Vulcanisaeta distributa]|uniref:hypothetical protein n=1 Tax=Vulcanisaeta distributa TaxID=164451 RepID=UPI001FB1ADBA|nr:hypothetical protein [Vulcanisaeta distributa]